MIEENISQEFRLKNIDETRNYLIEEINRNEVFLIKKVKNTAPWTYVISDLKGEEIVGTFYEKELQKTNQKEVELKK